MTNIAKNIQPVPNVMTPRLSKLELRHELGILYVIVDGETKLAMNTEQFIEFFQYALQKAYVIQGMLNQYQQQKGDPTVHCKTGSANIARAIMERMADKLDVDELAAKVAEKIQSGRSRGNG